MQVLSLFFSFLWFMGYSIQGGHTTTFLTTYTESSLKPTWPYRRKTTQMGEVPLCKIPEAFFSILLPVFLQQGTFSTSKPSKPNAKHECIGLWDLP